MDRLLLIHSGGEFLFLLLWTRQPEVLDDDAFFLMTLIVLLSEFLMSLESGRSTLTLGNV